MGSDYAVSSTCLKVALATHRHIHICTPHYDLLIANGYLSASEQPGRPVGTQCTESRQLLNRVGKWNTVKNLTKLGSLIITIKSGNIHDLAMIFGCLTNKVNQTIVELCFIDKNDAVLVTDNISQ